VPHDFNNLLTVIIGNLDRLSDDVAGNQAAAQKIERFDDGDVLLGNPY
jgi:hypothetical protein